MGGGDCLKYLKRGWNRKEGKANKDFKKGASWMKGVGALKRKGWNLLTNYEEKHEGKYKKIVIIKV